MNTFTHYRLCPRSRSVRLVLAELGVEFQSAEEPPWDLRPGFLALNPAGELPVLQLEGGQLLCGANAIVEYLAEVAAGHRGDARNLILFPGNSEDRAEVRRLIDWFHGKLDREVTRELLFEKVYARMRPDTGHVPDRAVLQSIRSNLRYHLSYISYLADQRRWLAGDDLSFADLAAAAHLSSIDYLGDIPWEEYPSAKAWYVRLKSRPSFRSILADKVPGIAPPASYADLDF